MVDILCCTKCDSPAFKSQSTNNQTVMYFSVCMIVKYGSEVGVHPPHRT